MLRERAFAWANQKSNSQVIARPLSYRVFASEPVLIPATVGTMTAAACPPHPEIEGFCSTPVWFGQCTSIVVSGPSVMGTSAG
jgi:hypothetical protein